MTKIQSPSLKSGKKVLQMLDTLDNFTTTDHNCSAEYRYIQRNVYVGNIYLLKKCPLLNNCPPCSFILPASLCIPENSLENWRQNAVKFSKETWHVIPVKSVNIQGV